MTRNEFRQLSNGDELFAHGNGYCLVQASYLQGRFHDSLYYVDLRLENDMLITAICENNHFMLEKA